MLITFGRSFYLTSTAVTGSTDLVISIDQDFNVSMWKSTDADETNANPYESSQIIMQDGHPFQVNSDIPLIAAVTTVNNSIEQVSERLYSVPFLSRAFSALNIYCSLCSEEDSLKPEMSVT